MNLRIKLVFMAMLFVSAINYAQEGITVKGSVTSKTDGEPILGANIVVVGTTTGTSTDFDGNYQINVKSGDVLQFSYLGFISKSITVTNQEAINVVLAEDANALDEVVVIGYGTQKKSHLTGAISKVVNEDLAEIAVSRVDDALVGQVSGVSIQATEGEAGSAPTIRIRGTGSVSSSSDPLIVVDGLVVDNDFLGNIDMNNVESFEILKDAASTAIYGSRGANGVILITSKSGKSGKTKFTYNAYTGFKEARQSDAYHTSVAEAVAKEIVATGELSDQTKYKQLLGVDNNWQDIIFDGGIIESHSFSARGGNEKTTYSTSLGYLKDEGVLLTDEYKRYNLKLKLNHKFNKKFKGGITATPSFSDRRRFDGSTHDILRQPSWLPLYLDENSIKFVNRTRDGAKYADAKVGDYAIQRMFDDFDLATGLPVPNGGSGTDISNTSNTNPAAKVLERNRNDYKLKFYGSAYLQYAFTDALTYKTSISGDFQNTRRNRIQGVKSHREGNIQTDFSNLNVSHLVTDNILSYNKSFGSHDFSAIAGISSELEKGNYTASQFKGFDADEGTLLEDANISAANATEYKKTLFSYFTRVNYAYEDKYLASVSLRRDGSSVFGKNNKYGTFPAVSVGWNIAKEDFLKESDVVSSLKFRVSYGVTGTNQLNVANFSVNNDAVLTNYYPSVSLLSNASYNGKETIQAVNIGNPDLKWERSVEINPGVDFGFLNNRISGSVDYYKRTSDQLLLNNPVSSTTGFTNGLVNLGEVVNSGIEVELRAGIVSTQAFKWSTTILGSKNKNELTNFGEADGQIQNVDSKRPAEWINEVGQPISSFYGWVVDKDIPLEYIKNPYHPIGAEAQDVYVKDLNGDGLIDDEDKTILGNPYPDLVWSLSNDFNIGIVDFGFIFQGSHGAEVRNVADQYILNQFNGGQDFDPETTPNQGFIKQKILTDDIIQDASYIALRTVSLGVTIPNKFIEKVNISKLRIYATAQNLLYMTADDYTGWNPESVNTTSSTTYGYQRGGSPIQQTVSIGLNLEF